MEKLKKVIKRSESFSDISNAFIEYCERNNLLNHVSTNLMYVESEKDIYYNLLLNSSIELVCPVLSSIIDLDLYKEYGYCPKDKDLAEWIKELDKDEYYSIASEILAKHKEIFGVDIQFNGKGYYTTILAPIDNQSIRKLSVVDISKIEIILK